MRVRSASIASAPFAAMHLSAQPPSATMSRTMTPHHVGGFSSLEILSDVACDVALLARRAPTPAPRPTVETVLFTPVVRGRAPRRLAPARPIKKATVANARTAPSRFCHICSRTAKKVGLVACANLVTGACRKVVCEKCFAEYVCFT